MNKRFHYPLYVLLFTLAATLVPSHAHAYWVWSPESGKWENPKKAAKDTASEQFDYARSYYEKGDYDRALEEFDKLIKSYPQNRMAAESQFYKGLIYEKKDDVGKAAEAFRTLVDRYPYSDKLNDAIAHEFELADAMFGGKKTKLLGVAVVPAIDTATMYYQHIVQAAPYGEYGAKAQYRLGEANVVLGDYESAEKAFQAVIDEYPNSELAQQAQYQIARTAYRTSAAHAYHQEDLDKAISQMEAFKQQNIQNPLEIEANAAISELRQKKAQSLLEIARFYEARHKYRSAQLYYDDVIRLYPDTPANKEAGQRIDRVKALAENPPKGGPLSFITNRFTKDKEELSRKSVKDEGVMDYLGKSIQGFGKTLASPFAKKEASTDAPQATQANEAAKPKREGPLAIFSKPFQKKEKAVESTQAAEEPKPRKGLEPQPKPKPEVTEAKASPAPESGDRPKKDGPLAIFSKPFQKKETPAESAQTETRKREGPLAIFSKPAAAVGGALNTLNPFKSKSSGKES